MITGDACSAPGPAWQRTTDRAQHNGHRYLAFQKLATRENQCLLSGSPLSDDVPDWARSSNVLRALLTPRCGCFVLFALRLVVSFCLFCGYLTCAWLLRKLGPCRLLCATHCLNCCCENIVHAPGDDQHLLLCPPLFPPIFSSTYFSKPTRDV